MYVAFDTPAANVGVVAADVVVIATAVSILGVTAVLWFCYYYRAATVVV